MAMSTKLVIGGVNYFNTDRIGARIHLDALTRDLDGYDEMAFSIHGGAPAQVFDFGIAVKAYVDFGLGAGLVLRFQGEVTDVSWGCGPHGWVQGYTCQGLKYQVDRVWITAPDLTGTYTLNRTPDDPYYAPSQAGMTLGAMFTAVLTIQSTANALAAVGVNYASLSPPTLAAATVADLALLTIVPPQPTSFAGESILNTLDQHLARWMPRFVTELQPDGTIRFKDTTSTSVFVPRTITLPGPGGVGDSGATWPRMRASTAQCATRMTVRGGSVTGVALLSQAAGTLTPAWSGANQSAWTLLDFTQPGNAKDTGTITALSANTATVQSASGTTTWASNYWPGQQGIIYMTNNAASGIALTENRQITTNTALSAGGTSIITWDASQPLDNTGYTSYRLVANASPLAEVGRLFWVTEPATGHTGLNTYIGAHLVTRSPIPISWANNSLMIQIYYATATIVGGTLSIETPMGVQALPGTGQFLLNQPSVVPNGSTSTLNSGWPATVANGLPTDVQILALYSRGINESTYPPDIMGVAQYHGTAFTAQGFRCTRLIDVPAYTNQWDATAMTDLAQEHLLAVCDIVYEGSGVMLGEPTWDVLTFNYSINYAIAGTTSPWSSINAPARSVTITWPQGTGAMHATEVGFSTRRRPFSGDDLYLHPSFTGGSILGRLNGGEVGLSPFLGSTGGGGMGGGGDEGAGLGGSGGGSAGLEGMLRDGPVGGPASDRERARRARGRAAGESRRKEAAERLARAQQDAKDREHDRKVGAQRQEADEKIAQLSEGLGAGENSEPIRIEDAFDRAPRRPALEAQVGGMGDINGEAGG